MPEESPSETLDESSTEETSDEQSDATEASTPEEIEATWKHRVSQKDIAHQAEAKALRDELALTKARADRLEAQGKVQQTEAMTEADQWKARYEEAQKAAEGERLQHVSEVREAKYPAAAEALKDAGTLAAMDEGTLAALNARLASGEPPRAMDPNAAPRRPASPPKSDADKTVEELEADLKRQAPSFLDSLLS